MFDFAPDPAASKAETYAELVSAARTLTEGEPDRIANMANLAALIWQVVPRLNWAGFYRAVKDELVLGPFIDKPACIRIPFGRGVCGTAAQTAQTQLVPDVHAFPGHIACDSASQSELVVPLIKDGEGIGVLEVDVRDPQQRQWPRGVDAEMAARGRGAGP